MNRAIALALGNVRSGQGGPFGAVIVRQGELLAEGVNRVTSSNDPTAHAEMEAIRLACRSLNSWQLTGCEMYTTCEPCPMCLGGIYWARLDRIYYACSQKDAAEAGFDDSLIYGELPLEPERRRIAMHQVMRREALAVFSAWSASAGRVPY